MASIQQYLRRSQQDRTQVAGPLSNAPKLQATITAGAGGPVQVKQAGKNKWQHLAEGLSTINPMLQNYGAIQSINLEEGRKLGEIEAAKNQLDIAQEGMNTAGEALVKQGLLPRSQLLGYQQGYRRRIGERVARNTYHQGLNDRLNEIKDPEADEDIVNRVMAEVREESLKGLEGKPLAQEGFLKYATAVENSFVVSANKARDNAVQAHHENLAVEELNNEFGPRLIAANPDEIGGLQNEIKQHLDTLSNEDRFEKSKVVEMFWNGVGMPTVSGLIVDGQPDKAEKVLEAMLDIDLTGKGGKLGNINREGAWIRSRAVELRNKIESKRNQLESEKGEVTDDIERLYKLAALAITEGQTENNETDGRNLDTIQRLFEDAGYNELDAELHAFKVWSEQDLTGMRKLLGKYVDNDTKRDAYADALSRFDRFDLLASQVSAAYLNKETSDAVVEMFRQRKRLNPNLTDTEFAAGGAGLPGGGPIVDQRTKAALATAEQEEEKKLWYDATDAHQQSKRSFGGTLESAISTIHGKKDITANKDKYLKPYEKVYLLDYDKQIKDASIKLADDPDREAKMQEIEQRISTELIERWNRLQDALKLKKEGTDKTAGKVKSLPTLDQMEEVEKDLRGLNPLWFDAAMHVVNLQQVMTGKPAIIPDFLSKNEDEWEEVEKQQAKIEGRQPVLFPATSPNRPLMMKSAIGWEEGLKNEKALIKTFNEKAPHIYKTAIGIIRTRYGFESIDQVPDIVQGKVKYDYRITPMTANKEMMVETAKNFSKELREFDKTPLAKQDRNKFPTLKAMKDKFGILDMADIRTFTITQLKLFGHQTSQ